MCYCSNTQFILTDTQGERKNAGTQEQEVCQRQRGLFLCGNVQRGSFAIIMHSSYLLRCQFKKNIILLYRCFLLKVRGEIEGAEGCEVPSQGESRNGGLLSGGPFKTSKMMLGPGEGGQRGTGRAEETGHEASRCLREAALDSPGTK